MTVPELFFISKVCFENVELVAILTVFDPIYPPLERFAGLEYEVPYIWNANFSLLFAFFVD